MALKDDLVAAMGRLQARQAVVKASRDGLRRRAQEQLDTMPEATDLAAGARAGAGTLVHRRHLALLQEREELERLAGDGVAR